MKHGFVFSRFFMQNLCNSFYVTFLNFKTKHCHSYNVLNFLNVTLRYLSKIIFLGMFKNGIKHLIRWQWKITSNLYLSL